MSQPTTSLPTVNALNAAGEYLVDAAQRQILFWDTMRRRGNNYVEHRQAGKPPVLEFEYEMLIDGRTLDRPCNYALLRILPDDDQPVDATKLPFVIVDPRAGHGPGIGGSKYDSQVGVAMRGGHAVYFVTFFPIPVEGQTLGDIAAAEALFIEEVIRRHPESPGKPCIIGNCQAGWAVAALASMRPEIMGPIILNGAPLSYWAGVDGKNPMRYIGGLTGGKWIGSLASDLGNGRFDGANLVANFENLNPSHTYWTKQYNLYAKVDTEQERYLDFETWWGGFFLMNAEEMDSIVSELFIGNKLARGDVKTSSGERIDLKNIRSPIVVFASHGDNITPPQQALNWIVDLYGHEDAIVANDQTIVYLLHEHIGHLGIFVSGQIARREHSEIVSTLEMIDRLAPGLYEMIIETKSPTLDYAHLEPGDFTVRFEERTIDDIHALDDEQRDEEFFSALSVISDMNDVAYKTFVSPWVKAMSNEWMAETMRNLHPMRMQRWAWSDLNPMTWWLPAAAASVTENRQTVSPHNFFSGLERDVSRMIVDALDAYRDLRDDASRNIFKLVYGPTGLGAFFPTYGARPGYGEAERDEVAAQRKRLLRRVDKGGFAAAVARMVFAGMAEAGAIERRSFLIARQAWAEHPRLKDFSDQERRATVREQALLMRLDPDRAIDTLPKLLPTQEDRVEAVALAKQILMVDHERDDLDTPLARRVAEVLDVDLAAAGSEAA